MFGYSFPRICGETSINKDNNVVPRLIKAANELLAMNLRKSRGPLFHSFFAARH